MLISSIINSNKKEDDLFILDMEVTIIFPHQLFNQHPALQPGRVCYMVEEALFFTQYKFHKQKIVLHRASMKAYCEFLLSGQIRVEYVEARESSADIRILLKELSSKNIKHIHLADPVDEWLNKRISKACKSLGLKKTIYDTPCFLNNMAEANAYFDKKQTYFQTAFYTSQRKSRQLLVTRSGEPVGSKWSFDAENRLKYPAGQHPPIISFPPENDFVKEAINYVNEHFDQHYGKITPFRYPVTFAGAEKWLDEFIAGRFEKFGAYEDAIVASEHFLHHSVLSPLLNIGLLTPGMVIERVMALAAKNKVPLNSLEGFVRQVVGWREFIRIVYEREGNRQRIKNFWGFDKKIPASFWKGNTGIAPIDHTIRKILDTGYCHHIERLMLLGNFMLLCEFDPDEVYRWFMELFIDSYDWVMVPNVYGMSQFADGGLMTTKPYISGSNYVLKMSNYKKGSWCNVWDALFWRFIHVNRDFFAGNPRLSMLIKTLDKMDAQKRTDHCTIAEQYLQSFSYYA